MKKYLSMLLVGAMIFSLSACEKKEPENPAPAETETTEPAETTEPESPSAAEGTAFAGTNGEKMVGTITIKSEWIPFAEPIVLESIFNNSAVISGEKAYVLADKTLKEFAFDGTKATFSQDIALDAEYENMQLGTDGSLYFSSFMRPLIGWKDGAKTFSFEGPKNVCMHSSGEWGISFFPGSVAEKLTISDGTLKTAPLGGDVLESVSSAFVTENNIFLWGQAKGNEHSALAVFDTNGKFKFHLGYTGSESFQPDSLGSITSVIETENGFLALDGNMRNIVLWKPDGAFIGTIDVKELFGTSYPWLSSAQKMPDGSIIIGLSQKRDDESGEEFLLYRINGF